MLQIKSPKLSENQSKRLKRRARIFFGGLKSIPQVRTGIISHVFPLFLGLLFLFLVYNLFSIRKIDCHFDSKDCNPEVLQKLNTFIGSNVLLVNQKQLIQSMKQSFPVDKVAIGFKMFNTFRIDLTSGNPPVLANIFLVQTLPKVSMDTVPESSEAAVIWSKPSGEISLFSELASSSAYNLWDTGLMTPESSGSSKIKYIFSEKPGPETVKLIYRLIKIVNKYVNFDSIQIVGSRVFLSQSGQPDIIVSVPFDENGFVEALKSLTYLNTIKKDAKVIDLRFKNPIIR